MLQYLTMLRVIFSKVVIPKSRYGKFASMSESRSYYISKLQDYFRDKQAKNPRYSVRALARDLELQAPSLSHILNGNRPLPKEKTEHVIKKLSLTEHERVLFTESLYRTKTNIDEIKISPLDKRFMLDESYGKIIAEWEHYAVLHLFDIEGFECTPEDISKRLAITTTRAEKVLNNLIACNLLNFVMGKLLRQHPEIRTTEDVKSHALRASHLENLEIAKEKLDQVSIELRDFSSSIYAIDVNKIPEAKTIIREFRHKMTALLKGGNRTEIYQMAIQFYPLSNVTHRTES